MRARSPYLLPIDHEMVAPIDGAGTQAGEIAAGIWFRIALAPQLVGAEDARQGPLLLLCGSPMNERRAQQVQRVRCRENRRTGAEIFLVEDHLLHKARAAPAIFFGPGDPDPAGGVHRLLPPNALFEGLAVRRHALVAAISNPALTPQFPFHPPPDLAS